MDSGAAASDVVAFSEEHTRTEHIALSEGGAVRAEPLPPLGAKRAREEAGSAAKGPCACRGVTRHRLACFQSLRLPATGSREG